MKRQRKIKSVCHPRVASLHQRNRELQATLFALVGECQDLALAAGLYTYKWDDYPPALRKARKLLGLPYRGPVGDLDIDPLIEETITMHDKGIV